jgi:hypothetical protein
MCRAASARRERQSPQESTGTRPGSTRPSLSKKASLTSQTYIYIYIHTYTCNTYTYVYTPTHIHQLTNTYSSAAGDMYYNMCIIGLAVGRPRSEVKSLDWRSLTFCVISGTDGNSFSQPPYANHLAQLHGCHNLNEQYTYLPSHGRCHACAKFRHTSLRVDAKSWNARLDQVCLRKLA